MTDDPTQSPLLSIMAKVSLTLDSLHEEVKRQREDRYRQAKLANVPAFVPQHGTASVPASGFAVIGLGGPTQGYYWNVRRLLLSGLTPLTTASGRADVYVNATPMLNITSEAQVSVEDWIDFTTTMPSIAYYGVGEFYVRFPERVHIVLSGASVGQQYIACAFVQNVQDAADRQQANV